MLETKEFAQRLRELRRQRGLSQTELANAVDVALLTVFRWEKGVRTPRVEEIQKLCDVLGCSETELLNGTGNGQLKITLTYDWKKYQEGGINMDGEGFELILGSNGQIGIKGAGTLTSRESMESFLSQIRLQVETAFEAQVKRGAVSEA